MSQRLLSLLLFALVVSGCSSILPSSDWCYEYDFRNSNYGFSVQYGSWSPGVGFRPDGGGRFAATYAHSGNVSPNGVIISGTRTQVVGQPTKVVVKADIYGISVRTIRTDIPASVNAADIQLAGSGTSDKLQITAEVGAPMAWVRLQVRGMGVNPFGVTNCDTESVGSADTSIDVEVPPEIGTGLAAADAALGSVDVPLTAPNGSPLLPALTGASTAFGFIKWIVSGVAADEVAGPFAPTLSMIGVFLVMNVAMTGVHFIIYGGIYIARWAIWLYRTVIQLVQVIATIVASIPGMLILAVILIIAGLIAVIVGFASGIFGG